MSVKLASRNRNLVLPVLCGVLMAGLGQIHAANISPTGGNQKAEKQGEFVNRVFTDATGDHKYVVFVPGNYTPDKKWPVILFLHGACNRGTDGRSQLISGLAPAIRLRQADYPFLVVFPQCEDLQSRVLGGWTEQPDDAERALKILDAVENDYSVDRNHECLVGLSMGGTGAWKIAARTPKRWAAMIPVSAMTDVADAPKVAGIPTWVFHAASDPLVATKVATEMVDAVNAAGGRAYFTEVTKRAHDLSNVVFTQPALTDWLLDPSREPNRDLTWQEPKGYNDGQDTELPFIPGAEMARAVRLRICSDVLDALCFSAPEKLAAKPMVGYVGGISQTTKVGGFIPVNVALSGLHYQGHIERIRIIPKAPNSLFIQAGLRNLTMTVSNSQLNGRLLLNASAGPLHVVIGHREPVWLTLELKPAVVDRRVQLNLGRVDFQIPQHNWYVTEPSSVHVRGLPMLNDRVSDGLVDGIYSRKGEFERQVINNVPRLVQGMEAKLNDAIFTRVTRIGQISMPIWQPRMRIFPEDILIDDNGITLVSGVTLATLGSPSKDFQMKKYEALKEFPPVCKTGVEVDIAETVVPGWSELVVAGGVNRFNALDFTPKEYHDLANLDFLQEIIPDLKRFGDDLETNVDFQLRNPIRLREPPADLDPKHRASAPGNLLTLSVSSVPVSVSVRKKGGTRWTPVGELDFGIDREYAPYVRKADFARRGPQFAECGPFRIEAKWKFDPSYKPENPNVDEERFKATILKAREAAQLLEGVKPDSVQDVVLNGVPLRMDAMDWLNQHLVVRYELPGVKLINNSGESLTYEVRGPLSDWSKPRTLAPGEEDLYRVPYPLVWRRRLPTETQFYTLPLGKELSFIRDPKPRMIMVTHAEDLHEEAIVPR